MAISIRQKLFGVGPLGAAISFVILTIAFGVDRAWGPAVICTNSAPLKAAGIALAVLGLGLHFWSMSTLRNWWAKEELCTTGPFRWFRHPLYAAWITLILPGAALYFNSRIILAAAVFIHPVWHYLVSREEKMLSEIFQDQYRTYASRTGRFFPRIWRR
jgi:protein-S-isoprenylcysteine O-methyltransferase Ste14